MDEPSSEHTVNRKDRPRSLARPDAWLRVLIKFVLGPLARGLVHLETFIHTRWEIVPVEELPEAKARWNSSGLSREQVRKSIDSRHGFLCPECKSAFEGAVLAIEGAGGNGVGLPRPRQLRVGYEGTIARRWCAEATTALKWMGQRLRMGQWMSVSHFLRRKPVSARSGE